MIFDRYITVDWSASNSPKVGKDSIWVCSLGSRASRRRRTRAPAARRKTQSGNCSWEPLAGDCVLIGFDFPYAYPRGFADALGLEGDPWGAVGEYLGEQITDDPVTNVTNRVEVAAAVNARLTHPAFWGLPWTQPLVHLSNKRDQVVYRIDGDDAGLGEWREVESLLHRRGSHPQQTWKPFGAGSVGIQTLTGIPIVARLCSDVGLARFSRARPFEVLIPTLPEGQPGIIPMRQLLLLGFAPRLSSVPCRTRRLQGAGLGQARRSSISSRRAASS